MTTAIEDDMPEPERSDMLRQFIREVQQQLSLFHLDEDGSLRLAARVLLQKRGCRRR